MPYMISFLPRVKVSLEIHWYQPVKSDQKEMGDCLLHICAIRTERILDLIHFVENISCVKYVVNYFTLKH